MQQMSYIMKDVLFTKPSFVLVQNILLGHQMRDELTSNGLQVQLVDHYSTMKRSQVFIQKDVKMSGKRNFSVAIECTYGNQIGVAIECTYVNQMGVRTKEIPTYTDPFKIVQCSFEFIFCHSLCVLLLLIICFVFPQ